MKTIFTGLFVISLLAIPVFAAQEGMNETGTAFVKAFQANDLEAVVALYAADAVLFPPDAVVAKGKEEIRADYAGLFDKFTVQEISLLDSHHETRGDLSYSWGRFSMTIVPKAGGEPIHSEGRFSDVSKKIGGKWQYIVDHASFNPPPATQTAPQ